jgi:hypothetical protein
VDKSRHLASVIDEQLVNLKSQLTIDDFATTISWITTKSMKNEAIEKIKSNTIMSSSETTLKCQKKKGNQLMN